MEEGTLVARVGSIADGEGLKVGAAHLGTTGAVAVFNDDGTYFALDDACSHMSSSLSDGWVEDGAVVCPMHEGQFCLRDGSVVAAPPLRPVQTHEVLVVGAEIRVVPHRSRIAHAP